MGGAEDGVRRIVLTKASPTFAGATRRRVFNLIVNSTRTPILGLDYPRGRCPSRIPSLSQTVLRQQPSVAFNVDNGIPTEEQLICSTIRGCKNQLFVTTTNIFDRTSVQINNC